MSADDRRWAMTDADRDAEFDKQYARLAAIGACAHMEYAPVRALWIAAKRPPIVTFIRQGANVALFGVEA